MNFTSLWSDRFWPAILVLLALLNVILLALLQAWPLSKTGAILTTLGFSLVAWLTIAALRMAQRRSEKRRREWQRQFEATNLMQFDEVQAALEAQSRQRLQLQTAAEVAAAATSILDLHELMQRSVNLIKDRFDLYYVGLFLVDATTNQAILKAATGDAGRAQLKANHRLRVGGRSLIGGATRDGAPRITQDVTLDEEWFPNPHLPETRSELALPLRVRGEIIGALTVQSTKANVFNPELISTLQTMSDQLAVAIQNAQLLSHAEARAERQEELQQISAQLHRTADVDEIIAIGLRALSERLDGANVALTLGREPMNENDVQTGVAK